MKHDTSKADALRYNSLVRATLLEFARANDAAAATTKKLQKQAILGEYLRAIDDDEDLRLAVRYCGGRTFALTDERVLGASGAIVSDAVLSILKIDASEFWPLVVKKCEIGEALSELWSRRSMGFQPVPEARIQHGLETRDTNPAALMLPDVSREFDDLARTGNQSRKREIIRDLFARCTDGREAAYLAKIIFSDLRTGVREGVLQAAIAQAFDKPLSQIQQAQLMIGNLDEVAVLARHDRLADARFQLFHPIQFMLATPQETPQEAAETMAGRTYLAEDKLDGIRAQVHKEGDRIAIYTRTMDRIDESFPDVVESLKKVTSTFLLDGEIVPWRDGAVLPFAHIQKRMGRKALTQKVIRENPAVFIAFDILYHEGELLMDRPLRERRVKLESLCRAASSPSPILMGEGEGEGFAGSARNALIRHNPLPTPLPADWERESRLLITRVHEVSSASDIDAAFCNARDCRNEGLVLKDPDSPYTPGRRGQAWLKLKTHLPTFDCVVTAAEYGHGKRRGVLSDYTFAVWNSNPNEPNARLVNIGKAYSGVTDEEIAQLTKIFLDLSLRHRGHVHLVQPKIVLEIACDQIQKSARHESGYALRFPRIKRIRWDKRPEDADRLDRIIEIYDSTANTARQAAIESATEPTLFDGLDP